MTGTAAYPLTVTDDGNTWAVTALAHPALTALAHPALRDLSTACPACLAHADSAVIYARMGGSRGATYGDGTHSVTVARVHALIDTSVL